MLFMNEWEIAEARERLAGHPVLGPATKFLEAFKNEVNSHSDGWPYWSAPVRSAAKLMTLIKSADPYNRDNAKPVTAAAVRAALGPIKSFMTRKGTKAGMTLPSTEGM